MDGRSIIARRYRDLCRAIFADQGGADQLSEARMQLIRRFAALAVQAEAMEARLANGEQIDIGEHALLSSTLVRIASRIGIDRRARNITPSLAEYLEASSEETAPRPRVSGIAPSACGAPSPIPVCSAACSAVIHG